VIAPVPFEFQGKAVRTIMKDGGIWFVAMDACAVLEHSNSRMAISGLDDDERGVSIVYTPGGPQRVNIVNESGLYNLVFTSRKPEAKAFRRWVTGVVLPTLRRTGQFEMNGEPGHARPVGDETSDGRATDRSRNGITVSLQGPGRYLVVLFHDGDRRIEQLSFSDAVSALAALDCRSVAYSYLTVASLWLIEGLAHEGGHCLLHGMTMGEQTVENDAEACFASPLRDDPRPMDGLVHATFVLARMHMALAAVLRSGCLTAPERAEAATRLDAVTRDYADGLAVVSAAALTSRAPACCSASFRTPDRPESL
jgi:prophage antirepressor-like protein